MAADSQGTPLAAHTWSARLLHDSQPEHANGEEGEGRQGDHLVAEEADPSPPSC